LAVLFQKITTRIKKLVRQIGKQILPIAIRRFFKSQYNIGTTSD
jgi:hypothetical protein